MVSPDLWLPWLNKMGVLTQALWEFTGANLDHGRDGLSQWDLCRGKTGHKPANQPKGNVCDRKPSEPGQTAHRYPQDS